MTVLDGLGFEVQSLGSSGVVGPVGSVAFSFVFFFFGGGGGGGCFRNLKNQNVATPKARMMFVIWGPSGAGKRVPDMQFRTWYLMRRSELS